ncbi:MAG: hypothetical protein GQF41_3819 [Candidatus Rifleibacterium amylolyticum]|nr:MAG: hypothetical protein GQF41_3819 [Candidatus Rifleibacterium amylolyticum]
MQACHSGFQLILFAGRTEPEAIMLFNYRRNRSQITSNFLIFV